MPNSTLEQMRDAFRREHAQRDLSGDTSSSLLLWVLAQNIPLSDVRKYSDESGSRKLDTSFRPEGKKLDAMANTVVNGLTQDAVFDLVVREWKLLPPMLRRRITEVCNGPTRSNNSSKAIKRLDVALNGAILSRKAEMTERKLVDAGHGKARAERRVINPSVAGAERAFAIVARPANYDSLSPAQKRKANEQRARDRREARGK
jgi:hypothetical protein